MSIETVEDLEGLKNVRGGERGSVLEAMRERVTPGITTRELDEIGAEVMARNGGHSAPRALY